MLLHSSRIVSSLESSPIIYLCGLEETKIGISVGNFPSEQTQPHRLLPVCTGKEWWCFSILYNWEQNPLPTYQDFKWEEPKCFIAAKFPELDF